MNREYAKLKVVILGSTGSLGRQTLAVLAKHRDLFEVIGLSANENKEVLLSQGRTWKVPRKNLVLVSAQGSRRLDSLVSLKEADIIVNVLSGLVGLNPTKIALRKNKILILGNKESLVAEGKIIMELAHKAAHKRKIPHALIPLDSEHNAIFEILSTNPERKIKKIILPCSGGPLLHKTKKELQGICIKDLLAHPRWKMGAKISLESALLINKGFEIIEAHYLFDLPLNKIKVLIHPECLIHGIVEFDSPVAYISPPDMKEHIENALITAWQYESKSANPVARKFSHQKIRPINLKNFNFEKISACPLNGIKPVLEAFNENPDKMKRFLREEEKIIKNLLLDNSRHFSS